MENSRTDMAYSWWLEAAQKFDYYMTGIALAIVAYCGKNMGPLPHAISREHVAVAGLALVLASAVLGLRRLEIDNVFRRLMSKAVEHEEKATKFRQVSTSSPAGRDKSSGKVFSAADAARIADQSHADSVRYREIAGALAPRLNGLYMWRNRLLIAGIIVIAAANMWPAHQATARDTDTESNAAAARIQGDPIPETRVSTETHDILEEMPSPPNDTTSASNGEDIPAGHAE